MSDPERWVDDPEVAPELQEALRRTAAAEPRAYDTDRGLARLQAGLVAAAGASAAGSAAASSVKGWLAWSLAAVGTLGLGGAVYVGVTAGSESDVPARVDGADRRSRASSAPGATVSAEPEPESEPSVMVAAAAEPAARGGGQPFDVPPAEPTPSRRRIGPPAAAPPPNDEPPVQSAPAAGQLRAETVQLAQVRRALEASPAEALRLAREGQRLFPHGVFAEEREALEVFALDRLGRDAEARAQATRFVARHPNGPLTSRVRAILENP